MTIRFIKSAAVLGIAGYLFFFFYSVPCYPFISYKFVSYTYGQLETTNPFGIPVDPFIIIVCISLLCLVLWFCMGASGKRSILRNVFLMWPIFLTLAVLMSIYARIRDPLIARSVYIMVTTVGLFGALCVSAMARNSSWYHRVSSGLVWVLIPMGFLFMETVAWDSQPSFLFLDIQDDQKVLTRLTWYWWRPRWEYEKFYMENGRHLKWWGKREAGSLGNNWYDLHSWFKDPVPVAALISLPIQHFLLHTENARSGVYFSEGFLEKCWGVVSRGRWECSNRAVASAIRNPNQRDRAWSEPRRKELERCTRSEEGRTGGEGSAG